MDGPPLCDECGAPWATGADRCARCGARRDAGPTQPAVVEGPAVERGWATLARLTVGFVMLQQVAQWAAVAHGPVTAWGVGRALVTLAASLWAWRRIARRDGAALVLWSWVMAASVAVMALTYAATERWAPLRGFDLGLTAFAWATVAVYTVALWRLRRVVLAGAVE